MIQKVHFLALVFWISTSLFSQTTAPALEFKFPNNYSNTGVTTYNSSYSINATFVPDRNNLGANAIRFNNIFGKFEGFNMPSNSSRTISFWYKPNVASTVSEHIFSYGIASASACFALQRTASGVLQFSNYNVAVPSTFSPVKDTWYFITVTYNQTDNTAKLYVNGVSVLSTTLPINTSTDNFYIGNIVGVQTSLFADIDELRIFRSMLTETQVLTMYQSYTTGKPEVFKPSYNQSTINVAVNPNQNTTNVSMIYGKSRNNLSSTKAFTVSPCCTIYSFSEQLTGLSDTTTYYYQIIAQNSNGTSKSDTLSFRTPFPYNYRFDFDNNIVNTGNSSIISQSFNNQFTTDRANQAFMAANFNGVVSNFYGDSLPTPTNQNGTYSFWFKNKNTTASGQNIFSYGSATSLNILALQINTSGKFQFSNYQTASPTLFTPVLNTWYYVTVSYNDATDMVKLYINGVLNYTTTLSLILNGSRIFYIGSIGGVQTAINSDFDDFIISNDVLSDVQIANIYNSYSLVTDLEIQKQENQIIEVYPNPTKDFINVSEFSQVYDLMGNKLAEGSGKIDVSEFADGIYIVKSEKGITKIVIE
ncbi:MAG: LamG-like jellyroll fold domain-containing protein [Cytophagales bacterium]